jgi:2-dehydro-3-deoxy-D-arabinonate dehydratase
VKLFRTTGGIFVEQDEQHYLIADHGWDELLSRDDLPEFLAGFVGRARPLSGFREGEVLAPIVGQEVWAAGVTYYRSRGARMEESKDAGGGDFYDRVYTAERPELFFKSTASRTVGTGGKVRIRGDAHWSVPEPELTLVVSPSGRIVGYTIGNDMSSRDIEGENLLYLPQAKIYTGSCALGPWITVGASEAEAREWTINLRVERGGQQIFSGNTSVSQIKRRFDELAEFLFRSQSFRHGAVLLTGTGIVPPDSFTLQADDLVEIEISGIGRLRNTVSVV